MVGLWSSTVQTADLIIFISLFLSLKTDSEKCYARSSCQLSGSLCFKLSWEYQNSRLQNGSQYIVSFVPARSPSTFSRDSGTDSFIFIASPGKFSPREPCSHNSWSVNLVHHTSCSDIDSFTPRSHPRSEFGHGQLAMLETSAFANISPSGGTFHLGKTFTFLFMTSYTWWEAICCCSTYLHPSGWHTGSVISLWWKMRKLIIYLPDTLCPQRRLETCLGEIWGSRSKRGKEWIQLSDSDCLWESQSTPLSQLSKGCQPPVLVTCDILKLNY